MGGGGGGGWLNRGGTGVFSTASHNVRTFAQRPLPPHTTTRPLPHTGKESRSTPASEEQSSSATGESGGGSIGRFRSFMSRYVCTIDQFSAAFASPEVLPLHCGIPLHLTYANTHMCIPLPNHPPAHTHTHARTHNHPPITPTPTRLPTPTNTHPRTHLQV